MEYISSERDSQGETPALYHVDATCPVASRCSASGQEGSGKGQGTPWKLLSPAFWEMSPSFPEEYVWDTFMSNDPSPSGPSGPSDSSNLECVSSHWRNSSLKQFHWFPPQFYSYIIDFLGNKESGQKVLNTIPPHFISEQDLMRKPLLMWLYPSNLWI